MVEKGRVGWGGVGWGGATKSEAYARVMHRSKVVSNVKIFLGKTYDYVQLHGNTHGIDTKVGWIENWMIALKDIYQESTYHFSQNASGEVETFFARSGFSES